MASVVDFPVTVYRKEVVAAALPMQEHWLPLSNLDLLMPSIDVGVFFCYKNPSEQKCLTFATMARILKQSLAKTLVSFYAFAGEVVKNSVGEPELLCNNRGVEFVEAYADVQLRGLQLYNPDASVEGKLIPKKKLKNGVLSVQATQLRCGGVIVSCTFDHRIADAYSSNMFLVAWAEMARSNSISINPSFRRSLLSPRSPGFFSASVNDMYMPISQLPPPTHSQPQTDHIISRIYYVTAQSIGQLQTLATSNGCKRTKLESFTAYLWQIVAKSERNGGRKCKIGIVVDGRTRLCTGNEPNSMVNYFGNVLSIPYGEEKAEELRKRPLTWVANAVHECMRQTTSKEHFLGLIDWVEAHRPEPASAKICCRGSDDGPALVVSSGQRFPVSCVDFGWGKPVFGSYHFPWGSDVGYVMPMPMPGCGREEDWVVYVHMLRGQVEVLEAEAGDVFRPFTPESLSLSLS